jgi:hypothetical protein
MKKFAVSLAGLLAASILAPLALAIVPGSNPIAVQVGPSPGSALKFDDVQTLDVRAKVHAVVLTNPSCLDGKVEDALLARYPGMVRVEESESAWLWRLINGQWVHQYDLVDRFLVDFGQGRVVEVLLTETRVRN